MSASSRPDSLVGITRISKACDPCRTRKTRCDIATQAVCSECLKRDQAAACTIRAKARPNRAGPASNTVAKSKSDKRGRLSDTPPTGDSLLSPLHVPPPAPLVPTPPLSGHGGPPFPSDRHVSFPADITSFASPARSNASSSEPRPSAAQPHAGSNYSQSLVEGLLEEEALRRYGLNLHLYLQPENIFDSPIGDRLSLYEIGLAPGDPNALKLAGHWIVTHFGAIHHNTPFLSLPSVLETANRVFATADGIFSVPHDDRALLYSILALGSLREQTYDPLTKRYRSFGQEGTPEGTIASMQSTISLATPSIAAARTLFRIACDELDDIDQPSEIAVQALFVMHTFVSNTSMSRRSRDYVARAIMMAHELGLNRRFHLDMHRPKKVKPDKHASRRRAMVYLYVYFSDVYLSALDNHSPLIKRQDFDKEVFDILYDGSSSGVDTPSGTPFEGLRAFVDLVTTIGSVLEQLHSRAEDESMRYRLVLQLDEEIEALRERLGQHTFDIDLSDGSTSPMDQLKRTATAGAVVRQIHYSWSRIALRAPFLRHPLLRHSSLSICARSAMTILRLHRHVVSAALLNLPWMQMRRTAASIYLVFLAYWKGEVTKEECQQAVHSTLDLLSVFATRWKSASVIREHVTKLATHTGLSNHQEAARAFLDPAKQADADILTQLATVASSASAMQPNGNANGDVMSGLLKDWDMPMFPSLPTGVEPLEDPLSLFVDIFSTKETGIGSQFALGADADSALDVHWPPW